jgi:hypothetical protein
MDTQADPTKAPAEWIADLRASKAEIERGEHVPMQPTLDRMQAAIRRIEERQAGANHRKA